MTYANIFAASLLFLTLFTSIFAEARQPVFSSDFEDDSQKWLLLFGAEINTGSAQSGTHSIRVESEASVRTGNPVTESGTMQLWVRTSTPVTSYRIKVLINSSLSNDAGWTQVGMVEGNNNDTEYHAKRVSVDDAGKKYLRLDIEAINGTIDIDDITVNRILLSTALQKNQKILLAEVLAKLRDDKGYELQTEALRTLGKNYTSQIEVQREYIEYGNGIYSTISLVLATSERSKMANPLGYATFKKVIDDVKAVSSPIQKARLQSLLRPFGDIAVASLNIVTEGAFTAFAEPFKSIVASTFERSSYENAGVSKKAQKFAEKNGLHIYQNAEKFLGEINKELIKASGLHKDLVIIQIDIDRFRKDLSKHLKDYLVYGGQDRIAENYNRVMSKDEHIREAALLDIHLGFARHAEAVQTRSKSNAQLIQFMLKANENIDALQEFKERFNLITAAMITFHDKFYKSISPHQNPFSNPDDRKVWELQAIKSRVYIQQSKEAFQKAYL